MVDNCWLCYICRPDLTECGCSVEFDEIVYLCFGNGYSGFVGFYKCYLLDRSYSSLACPGL